jgi:peptidoglycan/xylan/chitin deacetylase (PgdA/CDA1 family)
MNEHARWRGKISRTVVLSVVGAVVLTTAAVTLSSPAGSATRPTVVSLTFDDSNYDQLAAEGTMKSNGLVGTFYTVDGWVGASGYLAKTDLAKIAADGNEIAGHTVTHPDLITIDPAEAQRQVCDNRATLQSWGYKPVDFAYPFADANAQVETITKNCGYNTARGLGDVRSPASCGSCIYGETTPPPDPYYLEAPDQVDSTWTLAQMKAEVTNAVAHNGGWVVLTFHHICSNIGAANCQSDQSTTPTIYNAFISWLAGYVKTTANNASVKTVDQEVRSYLGASYPAYKNATSVPNPPPAAPGVNALSNPSLETLDANTGFPKCFQPGGWGTNTAAWTRTTSGHTGTAAEQLTVTNYASGDAKLLPTLDMGTCSPTVVPGKTYNISTWYTSTGTTQFALYYRNASNGWVYWTSSPWFATASTWTQAKFTTPAVPADAVAMTFGLALIANGTLVTDDYSLVDPGTGAAAANTTTVATAPTTRAAAVNGTATASTTTKSSRKPHSHARPTIPGKGGIKPRVRFAVPEFGGPVGKG